HARAQQGAFNNRAVFGSMSSSTRAGGPQCGRPARLPVDEGMRTVGPRVGSGSGRDAGMAEMMTTDVRAIMDRSPFDVAAVADLREVLNRDPSRYRTLREAVANIKEREKKEKETKPEAHLRLGVGEVLLGRYHSGLEHLKKAGEVGMAYFFRGLALENRQQYEQAAAAFAQAVKLGYDPKSSELHRAGALRRAGHADESKKI